VKTGVIVYIVGEKISELDFDENEAPFKFGIQADKVEVVFSGENNFDVMDAWWKLTAKGMRRITCLIGEVLDDCSIRLTGRELKLCEH
jgi:hypothetical protein